MLECDEPSYSDTSVRCVRVVGHEGWHVGFDTDGLVTVWKGSKPTKPGTNRPLRAS